NPVGAGKPAKQATRWIAPATPVIAGKPAPTGIAPASSNPASCTPIHPLPDDGQPFLPHTAENSQARTPSHCGAQPE
ncbi:hypothetical protein FCH70_15555, partial [Pseudomonas putida]|nr:hypothetical protein [Pseudomonas putida]